MEVLDQVYDNINDIAVTKLARLIGTTAHT